MKIIKGGITAAKGYKVAAASASIKKNGKNDLALIYSEVDATAAGAFTTNAVKAAPVLWDEKVIKNKIRGIVANSGNANACTSKTGDEHVALEAETYAKCISASKEQILVASTGVIGVLLPIENILNTIQSSSKDLDSSLESGTLAAQAIMTTDTVKKEIAVEFEIDGISVKMGGMAKGSGMIHPNMATLLSFVTTDANISQNLLEKAIKEAVVDSYNMISVDRDTSTNDTAIVLANGLAGNKEINEENENYKTFKDALNYVSVELAKNMAKDGEGATKFIQVNVKGAKTKQDARLLARTVVTSNLTKAAIFGEDANWGRVIAAMGYSGVNFDVNKVKIIFSSKAGEVLVMDNGAPVKFDEDLASKILAQQDIDINAWLQDGQEEATAWGCDLTYDYVKINGDYRS